MLALTDEELLKEILSVLSKSVSSVADPYSEDGSYAAAIASLPTGLRAMAATHHLDITTYLINANLLRDEQKEDPYSLERDWCCRDADLCVR